MRRWCCHWTDMHCKLHGSHLLLQGRRFHPPWESKGCLPSPVPMRTEIKYSWHFLQVAGAAFLPRVLLCLRFPVGSTVGSSTKGFSLSEAGFNYSAGQVAESFTCLATGSLSGTSPTCGSSGWCVKLVTKCHQFLVTKI